MIFLRMARCRCHLRMWNNSAFDRRRMRMLLRLDVFREHTVVAQSAKSLLVRMAASGRQDRCSWTRLQNVSSHIEQPNFSQNLVASKVNGFTVELAPWRHTLKRGKRSCDPAGPTSYLLPSFPLLCLCVAVPSTVVPATVSARQPCLLHVRLSGRPLLWVGPSLLPRLSDPKVSAIAAMSKFYLLLAANYQNTVSFFGTRTLKRSQNGHFFPTHCF